MPWLRGKPVLSDPRCVKCGYDLRGIDFRSTDPKRCPECGTDVSAPGTVNFGIYRQKQSSAVWATCLVMGSIGLILLLGLFNTQTAVVPNNLNPGVISQSSNTALLTILQTTPANPPAWSEVDKRLARRKLTQQEVDTAFDVIIADLKRAQAAGEPVQPLHWSGNFVSAAIAAKAAGPEKITELCRQFYRGGPDVIVSKAARIGGNVRFKVSSGNNGWQLDKQQFVWVIRGIRAGNSGQLRSTKDPDLLSGKVYEQVDASLPHDLTVGEHELEFIFDVGVLSSDDVLRGLNGKPGTADKWPTPLATWQHSVKRKVRIIGKDESPVALTTDPAKNPFKTAPMKLREALVRPTSKGTELVLQWQQGPPLPVNIGYRVTVIAGPRRFERSFYYLALAGNGGSYQNSCRLPPPALPADVTTIDIVCTPDPFLMEQYAGVDEIWGEPVELKGIPLGRYDLKSGDKPKP